uniref:Uncharacterized protein n=1 Tax=Tetranychus urticae TaxID=32264 RepID=T1K205_TETUR
MASHCLIDFPCVKFILIYKLPLTTIYGLASSR